MKIIELHCEPNHKNVTVCLSYENVRDIANGLYEASIFNPEHDPIYRIMSDIFELTKEGTIKSWWKDGTDGKNPPEQSVNLD